MADVFDNLPKGIKFRGGNLPGSSKRALSKVTRFGSANILHDKIDVIDSVLQKYSKYIRLYGGLGRLQRMSVARQIKAELKNKGGLSLGGYRMVRKMLDHYARGEKTSSSTAKTKDLAKKSGLEARKKEYALEEEKPDKPKISALEKRRMIRVGSAQHLINRISGHPRSFGLDRASLRDEIKNKFREGDESEVNENLKRVGIGVLGRVGGGVKGSALNRGIVGNDDPVVSVAELNTNNSSEITPKNFGGKRPIGL